MLKSMTGYGEAHLISPGCKINIQIKSLNHRFLDLVFYLPDKFLFVENKLRNVIAKNFSRGRFSIYIDLNLPAAPKIAINKNLAKDYFLKLKGLAKDLSLSKNVQLETILNLPGVIETFGLEKQALEADITPKILEAFEKAYRNLKVSQDKEGRAIFKVLSKNINLIDKGLGLVKKRIKGAIREKLELLVSEEEKEAFLRDKDITEEINRIDMHLKSLKQVFHKAGPVGKELDFILQELQRETNTIGAKSFDGFISKQVVITKTEIEKLREQVQNVE